MKMPRSVKNWWAERRLMTDHQIEGYRKVLDEVEMEGSKGHLHTRHSLSFADWNLNSC